MKKIKENNYKIEIFGKNSVMKYIIITLFLIFIIFIFMKIEICIEHLEIYNTKIKFLIKIKIYILKYIKIYSKKIKKKDLIKFINFSKNKDIFIKEKKAIKMINMEILEMNLDVKYGIKHIYTNIKMFTILNILIPMIINKYSDSKSKIKYNIKNDFKENYFKVELMLKLKIIILNIIYEKIKNLKYNENDTRKKMIL